MRDEYELVSVVNETYKICDVNRVSELTSESPVYIVDSPETHTAVELLNPAGCSHSGPALSDGKVWTSELWPEKHNLSLRTRGALN